MIDRFRGAARVFSLPWCGCASIPSQAVLARRTGDGVAGLNYVEAVVMGAVQGVAELFPVSSLGHAILIPALVGGSWARDLNVTAPHSPYLAFVVALHVATALALIVFYRRDWAALVVGFVGSLRRRRITTSTERLAWLLIAATVPVGLAGLLFDHLLRAALGAPVPVAVFLMLNGFVLLIGQRLTRTAAGSSSGRHVAVDSSEGAVVADSAIAEMPVRRAVAIGAAQIAALFPGISRSGSVMIAGRAARLGDQEAVRFAFLLATPAILAAGLLEIPSLLGPAGHGITGQVLVGSLAAFVAALLSVRFLDRYFAYRSLLPFAVYCLLAGGVSLVVLLTR